jgi:hypothetical protein
MMRFPSLLVIVTPLMLMACATPESRLASGLREAGMGDRMARCMAGEMADDLSLGQLLKLSKLGRFREKQIRDMSLDEFLKATRSLQDPEILKIATTASAICTLRR